MGSPEPPEFLGQEEEEEEAAKGVFFLAVPLLLLPPPSGFACAFWGAGFFPGVLLDFLLLFLPQGLVGEVTLLEKSSREGVGTPRGGEESLGSAEEEEEGWG